MQVLQSQSNIPAKPETKPEMLPGLLQQAQEALSASTRYREHFSQFSLLYRVTRVQFIGGLTSMVPVGLLFLCVREPLANCAPEGRAAPLRNSLFLFPKAACVWQCVTLPLHLWPSSRSSWNWSFLQNASKNPNSQRGSFPACLLETKSCLSRTIRSICVYGTTEHLAMSQEMKILL